MPRQFNRRSFLKIFGLGAAGVGLLGPNSIAKEKKNAHYRKRKN